MTLAYKIKIQHETFGELLTEYFADAVQFKLFLKSINACLELKSDLSFFNGVNFLVHIPYKHLIDSVVVARAEPTNLTDVMVKKSLLES